MTRACPIIKKIDHKIKITRMCDCGNKRDGFTALTGPISSATKKMWQDVWFMYTGQSALTITGYISGKRYRFAAAGEQQLIDYRDATAMMNVPVLKKVVQ